MKSTAALTTKEFEEIKVESSSVEDIEYKLIKEHLGQIKVDNLTLEKEDELIKNLMKALSSEKIEDEKVADFNKRVLDVVSRILKIEL